MYFEVRRQVTRQPEGRHASLVRTGTDSALQRRVPALKEVVT